MSCDTNATWSYSCVIGMSFSSWPPMVMLPEPASQKPAASLAMVDFPPPDGPTSAVILFCGMLRLTPWRIS